MMGLSPRVRGNRNRGGSAFPLPRSIPAGAGEPRSRYQGRLVTGVYPRGCGGTQPLPVMRRPVIGLSPRVRGNPFVAGGDPRHPRSIPAGAGEPSPRPPVAGRCRVYPRGCGGTHHHLRRLRPRVGLSPRVRGNRVQDAAVAVLDRSIPAGAGNLVQHGGQGDAGGSIPAGAGEPSLRAFAARILPVYPRGCGGTCTRWSHKRLGKGLSPRVRGNP